MDYETFVESVKDLPTWWLTSVVLNGYDRTDARRSTPLWTYVDTSHEGACAYYASLDDETRRAEASEILAKYGWDRRAICFSRS